MTAIHSIICAYLFQDFVSTKLLPITPFFYHWVEMTLGDPFFNLYLGNSLYISLSARLQMVDFRRKIDIQPLANR